MERFRRKAEGSPASSFPFDSSSPTSSQDDKLLLAFDALVLSEMLGREVSLGKIIHGDDHATLKVKTSALAGEVRKRLEKIAALLSSPSPPDLVLNRHCAECEFQARCRQKAMEKDDLSLLAGMSEKERQKLRSKGIFTVTQLSYTFRPRRRPKAAARQTGEVSPLAEGAGDSGEENPHRRQPGTEDRRHARLSGCRGPARPRFLLPHRRAHRQRRIRRPAQPVGGHRQGREENLERIPCHPVEIEKPVLIHYGSYETIFLNECANDTENRQKVLAGQSHPICG